MKKLLFICLTFTLFSSSVFAQRNSKSKKSKDSKIYLSALLNIDTEEIEIEQKAFNSSDQMTTIYNDIIPRNKLNLGFSFQMT